MKTLPEGLKRALDESRNDVSVFASEFLGIELHPGQDEFVKNRRKINVLCPANRFGKTTLLSILHIWHAFFKIGVGRGNMKSWLNAEYLTCALAPHSQQAEVVIRTIRQILGSNFSYVEDGHRISNDCKIGWFLTKANESYPMHTEYANGSKTLIRSTGEDKGKSIAAKSFAYIGYDEAGKSLHLEEELESTLIPRTADLGGTIDLVGTPDAESPSFIFFQELFWRGGGDGHPREEMYYSQEGSVKENPHIPKEYFDEAKELYGNSPYYEQVINGKFISVGDKVFDHIKVMEAAKPDIEPYIPYSKNSRYIIGIDTAIGNDDLVITVIDYSKEPFEIVRLSAKKGNSQSPQLHLQDIIDIFEHYNQGNQCNIILETFNGESLRYYYDMPAEMRQRTRCFGSGRPIGVTKKTGQVDRKEDILIAGRKILDKDGIVFSDQHKTLMQQLANYTQKDDKIRQDHVISFCLAVFWATDGQPKTKKLEPTYVTW